jgi:hypothetical protein
MNLETILCKISGDLTQNPEVLKEIREMAEDKTKMIDVVYGFGTRLSDELNKRNIHFEYVKGIRYTTEEGLRIALNISEEVKIYLEQQFLGYKNIALISPVEKVGERIINTNADEIVLQRKDDYQKIIVYTKEGRNKDKLDLPNSEVRYK